MVKAYYEKTQDADFMTRAISVLDLEYQFWLGNTTVPVKSSSGKTYKLNRYIVNNKTPRPESYLEDYNTVNDGTDFSDDVKEQMYADLATGAESGWDYSSRWLKDKVPGDDKNLLRSIETTQIVPIDLNALLWSMEDNLSEWFKTFGSAQSKKANKKKASYYKRQAKKRLDAIEKIMWNKDDYAFYDYNLTANAQRADFTPANTFPLWLGAIPDQIKSDKKTLSHVFDQTTAAIKKYPGLLTTSYYNTTQQWDFPNGWPPLTYVAMEGMLHVNDLLNDVPHVYNTTNDGTESSIMGTESSLLHVAKTLADRYTASAFCGWYRTGGSIPGVLGKLPNVTSDDGHMFEKFDVTTIGVSGSQGEYVSQVGFGWTNGVAMWIFNTFGNLTAPDCNSTAISYQL
jgi:alpha,alpha-trehalase